MCWLRTSSPKKKTRDMQNMSGVSLSESAYRVLSRIFLDVCELETTVVKPSSLMC